MGNMKKTFEPSFNIIRAVSAIMVVFTHFSYSFVEYGISTGPGLLMFKNGDIGGVFVTMFFMLSGAALLHNYPSFRDGEEKSFGKTLKNLAVFYKKRWLTIFPMFYIAWAIMYVINSRRVGGWFWGGPRKNFILTFLGMDGYFLHLGMNYYCLGEWFLGAIIILYILYPLLLFLWNRARIPSTAVILFFFLFNLRRHYFSSAPDVNIFIVLIKYYNSHITISDNMCVWTCVLDFWCGFILEAYALPFIKKLQIPEENGKPGRGGIAATLIIAFLLSLFFIFEFPLYKQEIAVVMGLLFYLIFTLLTPAINKISPLNSLLNLISRYSYGIFLVHHVLIYGILNLLKDFEFNRFSSLLMFIPEFAFIILVGSILDRVCKSFLTPGKK